MRVFVFMQTMALAQATIAVFSPSCCCFLGGGRARFDAFFTGMDARDETNKAQPKTHLKKKISPPRKKVEHLIPSSSHPEGYSFSRSVLAQLFFVSTRTNTLALGLRREEIGRCCTAWMAQCMSQSIIRVYLPRAKNTETSRLCLGHGGMRMHTTWIPYIPADIHSTPRLELPFTLGTGKERPG